MLALIWFLLSISISLGQLLVLSQTDWIIHGPNHLSLYATCYLSNCQPRINTYALMILSGYIVGGGTLFLSAILLVPYLICTNLAKPIEIVANVQLFAAILTTIVLVCVPFDVSDILCSPQELIKPKLYGCKLGWSYGIACILSLISISCPVIARLVADHRKTYSIVYHQHEYF
uniref:G-protein coupled receptors family 1 profile domain-containing protein n=1 Tax=Panagrolaimus sp. PS1159 TaxID=55785 RepID=A0AC35FKH5_9BILA